MQKFEEVTASSNKASRRHIIVLAHYFSVAREAMVRRLEELSLVRPETWDWFQANGGITDEQARQVLGDVAVPGPAKGRSRRPTAQRLNLLAAEAAQRGVLSEGQLARLLRVDRIELRDILTNEELEGGRAMGFAPHLARIVGLIGAARAALCPSVPRRALSASVHL